MKMNAIELESLRELEREEQTASRDSQGAQLHYISADVENLGSDRGTERVMLMRSASLALARELEG